MAQRHARSSENLDPLLDTMANVIGILVVLLAVTQLSVTNAMERIRDQGPHREVTAVQVDDALRAEQALRLELVESEADLETYAASKRRPGMLLEAVEPMIDELEALAGRAGLDAVDPATLADRVEDTKEAVASAALRLEQTQSQLVELDEILARVPAESRPKIARLPDPRPPPEGSEEVSFFCRYGQVVSIDLDRMRNSLHIGIRDALGVDRRVREDDRPWLINLFAKRPIGDAQFYWSLRNSRSDRLFADVLWRDPRQGESRFRLPARDSAYLERLAGESPRRAYVRFYVWSDSFDAYLEARYLAEARGFSVSWMPVAKEDEVGIDLLGGRVSEILID